MTTHRKQAPHGTNSLSGKTQQLFAEGLHLHRSGQLDKALSLYEQVLKLAPKHFDALHHIGIVAFQRGNYPLSVDFLRLALAVNADVAAVHANLGNTLKEMQRLDEALASYDRSIALSGGDVDAHFNRAATLRALGRLDDALQGYDQAIELNDKDEQAWQSRAVVLKELGQYEAAEESVARALALNPNFAEAHWGKALLDLQLGRFTEGWRGYEARWNVATLHIYDRERPRGAPWLGQDSLQGKTILVYAEQGLGDTLQFCRYLPLLAQRGARVVLEAPASLVGLLGSLAGVGELVAKGKPLPEFDFHCPLMSLPLAFDTQLDTIPGAAPYLFSDPTKVAQWASRLGRQTRLRVGVVWSGNSQFGNDSKRSLALAEFAHLFSSDCEFVVLQKELAAADKAALESHHNVRQFSELIEDFTDTAALCELMDLVVTVDTSVAHLAGALGKPTWVLLAHNPDWRWLLERSDSPWYPSTRLCRQTQRGDWTPVLERVRGALDLLLANQAAESAQHACPVCGTETVIHDVVDFNKSCEEARQRFLPLSGRPIYYHRCPGCGFALAPEFRLWSEQDFQEHIYNAAYIDVDPDYVSKRPLGNAGFLHKLFGQSRKAIRHLDYGGGSGVLSAALRQQQWNSTSYDPFPHNDSRIDELGKFNLITAFEVFEHVPDVAGLMRNITSLMADECVVIFSTLLSDGHMEPNSRITWWYASPRNGHVSLFSKQSLVLLAEQNGLQFGSFSPGVHCLFKRLPAWGRKLVGG